MLDSLCDTGLIAGAIAFVTMIVLIAIGTIRERQVDARLRDRGRELDRGRLWREDPAEVESDRLRVIGDSTGTEKEKR